MEGFVAEAMHAGALGLSTGLEFKPGREAPTDEIVRLNKVVGRYGGYYTSHIRNRDAELQESIDEFLQIIREGGTSGEISHFNVRNRTGAAPGAWQRAVDTMQAAREVEGLDVLADTTPFRDGLGADGRDPAAVGDGGRLGGDLQAAPRPRRPRAAARTSATATGASSTAANGTACGCRRARSTRGSRARTSTRSPPCSGRSEWDCYFDILAAAGPGDREHPPDRRALHRRAPGRDDHAPALLARRRRLHERARHRPRRHLRPPGLLRGARPLPDAPRPRARHAAARGGDPEDDDACRPSTSACDDRGRLERGYARRRRRARPRPARGRLDARRSAATTSRASTRCSSTAPPSSPAASTPGALPGRHLPRAG